jgi:glycerophosphoryl diester phosphodiesterase
MISIVFTPSTSATTCSSSPFVRKPPVVIAHASSTYFGPPNTIALMHAAVEAGADVVDVDMRSTADGILVASHDDNLGSATNGNGSLSKTSFAKLRALDAAWNWKDPNGKHSLRGKGIQIPTVEEILLAFPKRRVSLEFKTTGGEQKLCDTLRALHRTADVYVGSAGDAPVDRFKPICPEVVTTVTDALVVELQKAQNDGSSWCSPVPIGQPPFDRDRTAEYTKLIAWGHAHGLAMYTWTVDDPNDLRLLASMGFDGVYTGRPDIARAVFNGTYKFKATAKGTPKAGTDKQGKGKRPTKSH